MQIDLHADAPEYGDVALVYNSHTGDDYLGLLRVFVNGQWGVVSDYSWTIEDTNAVCHQLGRRGNIYWKDA